MEWKKFNSFKNSYQNNFMKWTVSSDYVIPEVGL
jgi:hypothetical protein